MKDDRIDKARHGLPVDLQVGDLVEVIEDQNICFFRGPWMGYLVVRYLECGWNIMPIEHGPLGQLTRTHKGSLLVLDNGDRIIYRGRYGS